MMARSMAEASWEEEQTRFLARTRRRQRLGWLAVVIIVVLTSGVVYVLLRGLPGTSPEVVVASGIDAGQAAQIRHDFDAAAAAVSQALATNDVSAVNDTVTGNTLRNLERQLATNRAQGIRLRSDLRVTRLEVLSEADPNDPDVRFEVRQVGSGRLSVLGRTGDTVTSSQDVTFDSRYWMRQVAGGRYAVTDAQENQQPAAAASGLSPMALSVVGVGALVIMAALAMIWIRSRRHPAGSLPAADPAPAEADGPALMIQTIGGFKVVQNGEDLGPSIVARRVSGLLWLRLLVTTIANPAAQTLRDDAAEELFPGVARRSQQGRMRSILHELGEWPGGVGKRVLVQGLMLSFDLDDCEVDALQILRSSREIPGSDSIGQAWIERTRGLLQSTTGEFLPMWEGLVARVTTSESAAIEPVVELRQRLAIARADLLVALGEAYMARREPAAAAEVLAEALQLRPERQDVASLLINALRAAGRGPEAGRLDEEYGSRD